MIGPQCKAPGCARRVWEHSKTGLCGRHRHRDGLCVCALCARVRAERAMRIKPVERDDVVKVTVTEAPVTSTAVCGSTITLKRMPWDA